ncbi:ectoine hydroxylase-related dioxygenase (phytanoyl-CoA dioxygenase family) [Nocardiopsis mwathae]|uniref:Ectoine hydroxylase-related dioxygenase (Phytanoyl-CoA dioxygenase family) n=1 Tax=Nocardiopsis mwathae TaxID=1472723 RepID=A0A7W9YP67_9ACTN|nr:phytanoyl-CoA dioxygenase family protein [Nocardiopsis mwathae]MBB6175126.1 ectoine hydroxylase-related dioxygenase (phytanoyl-CoA dioxygenase family) [Nocardiopsis mwathae]
MTVDAHATADLPKPTADHDQARADLREHGYCVLAGVLDADEIDTLRGSVLRIAERERDSGTHWSSNGNQKSFMLINHGREFLDLVENPVALDFSAALLGPDLLLSSITANTARPGNVQQQLHADQQYVPEPWPYVSSMNVVWALDDFTEENGATVVVPGSHRQGTAPRPDAGPLVPITGPAGSAVVLDGRVWHAAGANRTESELRVAILSHYCAPFIRQQENIFRSIDPDLRRRLTPSQRRLFGYDIWSGLGVVNGLPRDWAHRKDRSGPTNADGIFPE